MRRSLGLAFAATAALCGCSELRDRLLPSEARVEASAVPSASSAPAPAASQGSTATARAAAVKPPEGYLIMHVGGVAPTRAGSAVVLTDETKKVGVPIFIGGTEALSIALRLRGERYARPLTHDLLDDLVGQMGAKVVSVRVDKLENQVFHGSVLVDDGRRVIVVDARPSDAIALAVGNAAPIHVARKVVESAGIDMNDVELHRPDVLDEQPSAGEEPEQRDGISL